jgi:hypothetical protein
MGLSLNMAWLSDDEDGKVKSMETSPNLNLDIAPLLAYRPLFKIYAWVVWLGYLHVSHINTHLYWTLKKFHAVWNQKVTWNDKLYPCWNDFTKCLNCTIKWMRTWDVNQTLPTCSNNSNWTLQQKLWRVHVEQRWRKYLKIMETQDSIAKRALRWPRNKVDFWTRYEGWPKIKVE